MYRGDIVVANSGGTGAWGKRGCDAKLLLGAAQLRRYRGEESADTRAGPRAAGLDAFDIGRLKELKTRILNQVKTKLLTQYITYSIHYFSWTNNEENTEVDNHKTSFFLEIISFLK